MVATPIRGLVYVFIYKQLIYVRIQILLFAKHHKKPNTQSMNILLCSCDDKCSFSRLLKEDALRNPQSCGHYRIAMGALSTPATSPPPPFSVALHRNHNSRSDC